MKNGLLAAITPFDRQPSPIRFNDGALIIAIAIQAIGPDFSFWIPTPVTGFARSKRSLDRSAELWPPQSCFIRCGFWGPVRHDGVPAAP